MANSGEFLGKCRNVAVGEMHGSRLALQLLFWAVRETVQDYGDPILHRASSALARAAFSELLGMKVVGEAHTLIDLVGSTDQTGDIGGARPWPESESERRRRVAI